MFSLYCLWLFRFDLYEDSLKEILSFGLVLGFGAADV